MARIGPAALALFTIACASLQWQPIGPRRTAEIEGASPVGAEECLSCHVRVRGHRTIARYHADCEACHGAGNLHSASEKPAEIRFPDSADCLRCHASGRDTHLQWGTGGHSRAGLLCTDCHQAHSTAPLHLRRARQASLPNMDARSQLCVRCHQDVGAELSYPSHHPIGEGALSCVSCHDPHEDRRLSFGDRNRLCASCHQDSAGPWVFEHPPVVEGCVTCHDPHGAVSPNLLQTVQPAICLSCHTLNDLWHHDTAGTGILQNTTITEDEPSAAGQRVTQQEAGLFLRRCTDCHGAIHGSYTDEHLRH